MEKGFDAQSLGDPEYRRDVINSFCSSDFFRALGQKVGMHMGVPALRPANTLHRGWAFYNRGVGQSVCARGLVSSSCIHNICRVVRASGSLNRHTRHYRQEEQHK